MVRSDSLSSPRLPVSQPPTAVRVWANLLRTVFIILLIAIVVRVALPQSETIWSSYETPGDLVRLALGLGICVWLIIQLVRGPVDISGYRTWLYLGPAAIPFALLCLWYIF